MLVRDEGVDFKAPGKSFNHEASKKLVAQQPIRTEKTFQIQWNPG